MPPTSLREPLRRIPWPVVDPGDPEALVTREWLVTNGLGGYASGTIAGVITRRYHGLLIAALSAPLGRTVMLSHVAEQLRCGDGRQFELGGRERSGDSPDVHGLGYLTEFRLEAGLPVWRYDVEGVVIEKRVFLPHMQNTVYLMYELLAGADRIELALRPSVNFRAQEAPVSEPVGSPYEFRSVGTMYEIAWKGSDIPALRLKVSGSDATFTLKRMPIDNVLYPVEESRGYQSRGALWSPGYFALSIQAGQRAALLASTESNETMSVLDADHGFAAERGRRRRLIAQAPPTAREGIPAELVLAADQFIITPAGRTVETARAHAYGDEVRTIVAGYHWFTDWGRDTMISLEGLTLATGRLQEAAYILRTFAHYVRNGLIPNMFPEGEKDGLYHTADATLWFFHAVRRYVEYSGDQLTLALLYPTLKTIVDWHVRGTQFGIHVDPGDGLLVQGADGYQLTWMDAKVDDWVVTPRRGKAVEINALWYNALRLMEGWAVEHADPDATDYRARADRAQRAFNDRFWYARGGYLYDVVDSEGDGDDPKCRPNQIFAIALPHPVLAREHWEAVIGVVRDRLLTPAGLRTLAPDDPDFKPRYFGDLRARDAAYHQGTVWAWLIGPFVDAWLRVYPADDVVPRRLLDGFVPLLQEACIGSISEIFDAEKPYTPRGCIAQAWSVAEVLRAWIRLANPEQAGREGREGQKVAM
ncbi:MAG TPA: amylo-alpha-1,6-glucosidase [Vicinamibacterales bacterium]|nr:amylo-alpha-1,6-glucosidase [Vicinamibacterales bacterium]